MQHARRRGGRLSLTSVIVLLASASTAAAQACVGDCTNAGNVTINELIIGVNIALGTASLSMCPSFDVDHNEMVTVNELIAAVNSALNGCTGPPGGVHLSGDPSALAVDATVDMPPVGVDESEIQDGVIMTRLDLHLAPGATVGQVNAALALVNGGVVSMLHGHPAITIAIPRPADLDALATVVQTLRAAPGISWTAIAHVADPKNLPPSPAGDNLDQLQHLLPARFPAAWNASHLATNGCAARKVKVLVADILQRPPLLGAYADFFDEIPASNFTLLGGPGPADLTHGYDVTTTLAALFNTANPTGADPFTDCLQIDAIQMFGMTESQRVQAVPLALPAGKFLMNYSLGYADKLSQTLIDACRTNGCTVKEIEKEIDLPLTRAYDGADWISLTSNRRDDFDDFLVSVAAGNERKLRGTAIYSGLGIAVFDAAINVATLLPRVDFLSDVLSWNSGTIGFPQLVARDADIGAFQQYMQALGVPTVGAADNALIVGSATTGRTADALVQSAFSDAADNTGANGADLFAVGEQVFTLGGFQGGTSFAAPQVAGLASYLWLLSPALQSRPVAATRQAILQNARGVGVIDAYASALSLDAAALPTPANAPVRLALLDVNDDGKFDETDLDMFLNHFFTGEVAPQDYGRFDLNGDGFTGGSTTERFDLDRVGSTQFGTTAYSTVTQSIEGEDMSFDEHQLSDLQILCYYAYSALYTGDPNMRTQLTAGHCTISVTVDPAAVTLAPGASQQFSATVRGTSDPRVTWRVVAGDGTVSDTGLFTAGQTAGTSTVRAISVADPNAFGETTVTVAGCRFSGFPIPMVLQMTLGTREGNCTAVQLQTTSSGMLTDSVESPGFMDSATVREGFIQLAASDDDTAAGANGCQAVALGMSHDTLIINPATSALQGTPASVTVSIRVTASPDVSGDSASANWALSGTPFLATGLTRRGTLSTVPGQTSGDVSGGTYTVTLPTALTAFGKPFALDLSFSASVGRPMSATPSLTGAGHIDASVQWLGITDVRDQEGNAVAFAVCSASGANWLGMP